MKKTLYVSDLDGTLFNRVKQVSDYTVTVINRCIDKGARFTVATARMPYGCEERLKSLRLNVPGIVTNGVFLYDFSSEKYLHAETIDRAAAHKFTSALLDMNHAAFLYCFDGNTISLYYDNAALESEKQYYSDRALEACKTVALVSSLESALGAGEPVYFARTGTLEDMQAIQTVADGIAGLASTLYLNVYNGLYCLEIMRSNANKKTALTRLKSMVGCDEIVVFGDNHNDLPMIEMSDRSYAPENALDEVKARVTGIIASCDDDGVAQFMDEELAS